MHVTFKVKKGKFVPFCTTHDMLIAKDRESGHEVTELFVSGSRFSLRRARNRALKTLRLLSNYDSREDW